PRAAALPPSGRWRRPERVQYRYPSDSLCRMRAQRPMPGPRRAWRRSSCSIQVVLVAGEVRLRGRIRDGLGADGGRDGERRPGVEARSEAEGHCCAERVSRPDGVDDLGGNGVHMQCHRAVLDQIDALTPGGDDDAATAGELRKGTPFMLV